MWRPTQFTTVLIFVVTVVVIPLTVNIASEAVPDRIRPYLWLALPVAALSAVLAAVVEARRAAAAARLTSVTATEEDMLRRAADQLSQTLRGQWYAEAEMRMLHRPQPLRLRWSATGRPVSGRWMCDQEVTSPETATEGDQLHGVGHNELAGRFLQLPHRRLVVLGEPGAGKTVLAILLTLDLLEHRRNHEGPVPVLLSLSSWDPRTEHLHTWVARRLVEDYPALANVDVFGHDTARRLVTQGRVLPIVDGLDEMPTVLHTVALEALDRIAPAHALVVTCRSIEYEAAVTHGGVVLSTAAVVELSPVDVREVITFLDAGGVTRGERWVPVLTHLRDHPDGPLAQALSSPLMTSLLRTVYRDPANDPAELVDSGRFPDRAAVEDHLLDAFVPAAYHDFPSPPAPEQTGTGPAHYPPDLARTWLAFLARHLHENRSRDLALWRLHHGLSPTQRRASGLVLEVLTGCVSGVGFATGIGWDVGLAAGLAGGFGAGLVAVPPAHPGQLNLQVRGRLRLICKKLAVGQALAFMMVIGCVGSVALAELMGFGPVGGVDGILKVAFTAGLGVGLGFGAMMCLNAPADAIRAPSPRSVLHDDRAVSGVRLVVETFGSGSLAGFLIGHPDFGLSLDLRTALVLGLGGGLAIGLSGRFTARFQTGMAASAWAWYSAGRYWLAFRGRLPWRLMRFLTDAHRRGVLRQTGAVYQFRHARLQDRLAEAVTLPPGP